MKTIKHYLSYFIMSIVLTFGVMIVLTGCDHVADSTTVTTWRGQPFDSAAQARFLHELACPSCPPHHP